jgi:hypothetical protein
MAPFVLSVEGQEQARQRLQAIRELEEKLVRIRARREVKLKLARCWKAVNGRMRETREERTAAWRAGRE